MYRLQRIEFNTALELEGYANRDSLKYQDLYGLESASLVRRGTLRYRGYTGAVNLFKELDIFNEDKVEPLSWRKYLRSKLRPGLTGALHPAVQSRLSEIGCEESRQVASQILLQAVVNNP